MRKVFINKWFLLAAAVTISLSAVSFVTYKKTQSVCSLTNECPNRPGEAAERSEMLWDVISGQFTPFISVQ